MLYGFSYPVVVDVTYGGYRNGFRGHSSAHKKKTKTLFISDIPTLLTGVYILRSASMNEVWVVIGKQKVPVDVSVVAWRFK